MTEGRHFFLIYLEIMAGIELSYIAFPYKIEIFFFFFFLARLYKKRKKIGQEKVLREQWTQQKECGI